MALLTVLTFGLLNKTADVFSVLAATDLEAEAPKTTVDPTGDGEGYSAVLYDNTNGLPTSEANAIAETSDGFIWIGSYSGLIRYDGNTFERIDSTTGIASVVTLFVDSRERLWIGTNDSGVAVMENNEYHMYHKSDGLKSSTIRSIVEGSDGNIYIATTRGIAMVDQELTLHTVDEPLINEEYIRVLRLGADDVIYGVTTSGAVFTMQDGKLTGYYDSDKMGVSDIRTILPDASNPGYVYFGTAQSEIYYGKLQNNLLESTVIDVSPLEYINSIDQVNEEIWISSDNGIGVIRNGKIIDLENIPVDSAAEGMIADYQGNLWFVSSKQGVMKIVPNQFTDIFERYDLPTTVINTTCMYQDMLFIGTKSDGLIVVDQNGPVESLPLVRASSASGETIDATDLIEMLQECRIRSIVRDSKNRLWISTFGENALLRYDNGTVTRFTMEDCLPSDRVRTVWECQDGTFLVACTGGLTILKDDVVTEIYGETSGIRNPEILTAIEAKNKDLVIGTDGDGIYVIRDSEVTHIGTESGLASEVVMRLKYDLSRDIIWIVTSNSLAYMDADYNVTTIKDFPYSNNFDLYQNSKGEMWVFSSNGIYVTTVDELLANEEISTVYYGRDNGLSCITTSNSYSELTKDGDLYISGSTGVAKVNIEQPFESVDEVKMSVPYVETDGTLIQPDDTGTITIPSNVKKLTIYSEVYNYTLMNPQVTYYLDGFDDTQTTVRRSELVPIDYTNLRGGSYHFVMLLSDAQGRGNKEYSVSIVKEKALYELLWFRILCGAAVILLIASIVMLYIRHKTNVFEKKEKQQKQLIREIVEAFAKVIDMKDTYTNGHSSRVAEYTVMLAKELGYDEETVEQYYNIALMHDIGKIGVAPEVLNKPGKLTDEEYAIIKSHAQLGYDTLKGISIMPELAIGAGAHHERPDGKGYPRGLKGDEIPRVAQIIAVADTFDAMYSTRPYRKRMNFEKAVSIIKEVRGTQLTEDVVDAFLRLVEKGEFRDPDDHGGGTTEDIDNIHKKYDTESKP
ncbi:MAG: HD domain-containing protein [Lachnospiraceae bacterium]|nr:HD domain-containing protein [Lachnospiraceae bacterium]